MIRKTEQSKPRGPSLETGFQSHEASSKYLKHDSYQKHMTNFIQNDNKYDEPMVIEEAK